MDHRTDEIPEGYDPHAEIDPEGLDEGRGGQEDDGGRKGRRKGRGASDYNGVRISSKTLFVKVVPEKERR